MYHNPQLAFQPLSIQQAEQTHSLKKQLEYLLYHSPFYKNHLRNHHAVINSIQHTNDLVALPTTTKEDIQRYNLEFLCVPKNQIKEYTATSGTLGKPVTIALTSNDIQRLGYNEQHSFLCASATHNDIFQLMLTLDRQFMAGMAYYNGISNIGAASVRTGPGLPSMQWETIQRLQVDSIVAVPSFILKLIDYAKEHGIDVNASPIKKAICIGENLREQDFSLNSLSKKIKDQWNIELYGTYAATEMQTAFTECSFGVGGHEQPELIITEILDEEGNQLPAREFGEVTITTLGVEGMPLLRYRTGDIACFHDTACACGRHSKRLSPIKGRKQQMIKFKGTTLYPPAIFDLLNQLEEVKEYVVEVAKDALQNDSLKIYILGHDSDVLRAKLKASLRVMPLLEFVTAEIIQKMQFPLASRKQIRFIDKRDL